MATIIQPRRCARIAGDAGQRREALDGTAEKPVALADANAELVLKLRRELAAKRVKIKRMGGRSALFLQRHLHIEANHLKDKTELKAELSRLSAKHSEELSRRQLAQNTLAVMKDRMAELKKRYVKETRELKSDFAARSASTLDELRMEKARSASALDELKEVRAELKELEKAHSELKREIAATTAAHKVQIAEINAKTEASNVRLDKLEVKVEEDRKWSESKHDEIIDKGKVTDARIEEVREGILKELLELRTANKIYESKLAEKGADLTSIRREILAAQEQQKVDRRRAELARKQRTEGAPCGAASRQETGRTERGPTRKSCIAIAEKENRENAASDAYDKMIVNDLRKELRKRDLSVEGRKAELQARLRHNDAERASTLIDLCSP